MEGTPAGRRLPGRRPSRTLVAASLLATLTTALAACSSGSTKDDDSGGGGATATAAANTGGSGGKVSIFVIGGKSDDPFWSTVKRGGEDAAKMVEAAGGTVTFLGPQNYDNLGPDAAKLALTALSQNPSAVVGPDWVPENQNEAWKEITGKGVPVFLYNAGGAEQAKAVGALKYVGSDEYEAGKAGGERFGEAGAKNVLCVNTLPGAANTEARCKGVADGAAAKGAKSTQLAMPSSTFGNPSAITQGIKAALLKDKTVNAVITIGVQDADSAAAAIEQGGVADRVQLGTFDVSQTQLDRIKAGRQLFAIDQQPYLQGYYAVSMAFQYVSYGLIPPQNPMLTGPLLITADNVDSAIEGTRTGVR
jgi:simple sugar transport system substrate-binding protein